MLFEQHFELLDHVTLNLVILSYIGYDWTAKSVTAFLAVIWEEVQWSEGIQQRLVYCLILELNHANIISVLYKLPHLKTITGLMEICVCPVVRYWIQGSCWVEGLL